MKVILERVAEVATVFDDDGISVRFMNARVNGDHIKSSYEVQKLLEGIPFKYTTPLGTELKNKVIEPFALQKLRGGQGLSKPIMIIIITDGEPHPEPRSVIYQVIGNAKAELQRLGYPAKSIAYQFAQCGRDEKAQEFLSELDSNPAIGDVIDAGLKPFNFPLTLFFTLILRTMLKTKTIQKFELDNTHRLLEATNPLLAVMRRHPRDLTLLHPAPHLQDFMRRLRVHHLVQFIMVALTVSSHLKVDTRRHRALRLAQRLRYIVHRQVALQQGIQAPHKVGHRREVLASSKRGIKFTVQVAWQPGCTSDKECLQ
ncbi:hypothetical protein HDU96_009988 [Phlyctochytrium bullatum]|nr:hypothetical protein HDU96_009988 [Phlyctochytrium bullatum]